MIELAEGMLGSKIGHSKAISETTVPTFVRNEINGNVFIDCPGFRDTKSDEYDIANASFTKRIFSNINSVKIVVIAE